jgi:hypothetical protein
MTRLVYYLNNFNAHYALLMQPCEFCASSLARIPTKLEGMAWLSLVFMSKMRKRSKESRTRLVPTACSDLNISCLMREGACSRVYRNKPARLCCADIHFPCQKACSFYRMISTSVDYVNQFKYNYSPMKPKRSFPRKSTNNAILYKCASLV